MATHYLGRYLRICFFFVTLHSHCVEEKHCTCMLSKSAVTYCALGFVHAPILYIFHLHSLKGGPYVFLFNTMRRAAFDCMLCVRKCVGSLKGTKRNRRSVCLSAELAVFPLSVKPTGCACVRACSKRSSQLGCLLQIPFSIFFNDATSTKVLAQM